MSPIPGVPQSRRPELCGVVRTPVGAGERMGPTRATHPSRAAEPACLGQTGGGCRAHCGTVSQPQSQSADGRTGLPARRRVGSVSCRSAESVQPDPLAARRQNCVADLQRRSGDHARQAKPVCAPTGRVGGQQDRPKPQSRSGRSRLPARLPANVPTTMPGSADCCGRTRFTITSAGCPAGRRAQARRVSPAHGGGLSGISW